MIEPFYVDTGLDNTFNSILIKEIIYTKGWALSGDIELFNNSGDLGDYSDSGFQFVSFLKGSNENHPQYSTVNSYASLIGNIVLKKQKNILIKNYDMGRFFWSYYNKASNGLTHVDTSESMQGDYLSIVYYLNNNDGGTEVDGKKYNSKAGYALVFNSRSPHRGFGPYNEKMKLVLNIMLRINF